MNMKQDGELHDLLTAEIANITANASRQGFSEREILSSLAAGIDQALRALDAAEGSSLAKPRSLPAGPHSTPALVDKEKTPGTGALPNADAIEIDPGVG